MRWVELAVRVDGMKQVELEVEVDGMNQVEVEVEAEVDGMNQVEVEVKVELEVEVDGMNQVEVEVEVEVDGMNWKTDGRWDLMLVDVKNRIAINQFESTNQSINLRTESDIRSTILLQITNSFYKVNEYWSQK